MTRRYISYIVPAVLTLCLYASDAMARNFKDTWHDVMSSARAGFNIEWGYTGTFLHKYHNDYIDSTDGYRVDVRDTDYLLYSNAFMQAGISVEAAQHYALGINCGFAGVFQDRRMFPVSLRFSYFFNSYKEDGLFAIAEAGKAFVFEDKVLKNNIARLGGGYRFTLSNRNSMDINAFAQLATDHPAIYNMNIGHNVQPAYLRCSDSYYAALVFSVALSF